jgi:hypothetical protein
VQLIPWPAAVVQRVSPQSVAAHKQGVLSNRAAADDPDHGPPSLGTGRAPLTVNRSATIRWLASAATCLALFCVAAHFADRLGRAMIVWGSVVASLFVCATFGVVQLVGGSGALYGVLETGNGPSWCPSTSDLMTMPNTTVLRPASRAASAWSIKKPDMPAAIGGLMGGTGAFLALGSLGLPLSVGLLLQLLAPRGSREGLARRLALSGHMGLAIFLLGLSLLSAGLIGRLAGTLLCLPFVVGVVLAGLPGAWSSGLRWTAIGVTALVLAALGLGLAIGRSADGSNQTRPFSEPPARPAWGEAMRIARDFPVAGAGLGSFASISPYYKTRDETTTTARSSLLQWWAETGAAGLVVLGVAVFWSAARLPAGIRRVGSADRTLAYGLLGTLVCFGLFSALHWTVELTAVALAASAVGGTFNRWLAGGTDLLVEAS